MSPPPIFGVRTVADWCALAPHHRGSVDHVLTDPPYPEHVQGDGKMFATTKGRVPVNVVANFDPLESLDFAPVLSSLARRWSLYHCALESLGDYRLANVEGHVRSCLYVKDRAQPQLSKDRPGSKAEGMALFHSGGVKKAWNNGGTHNVFYATPENRAKARHPTPKPLMLCLQIVEAFTLPGETILDPFCGAGNYGLAAYALGRVYMGTDFDPVHVASAQEKLALFQPAKALEAYAKFKSKDRWIREGFGDCPWFDET